MNENFSQKGNRINYFLIWLGIKPQVCKCGCGEKLLKFGFPYFCYWIKHPIIWWRLR